MRASTHGTHNGKVPVPLGRLAATRGLLTAVRPRFEQLAGKAWFTRKLTVLIPEQALSGSSVGHFAASLHKQYCSYELTNIPIAALGDQMFANAVKDLHICCLSCTRGLEADNVLAIVPTAELVASVNGPTFEHLGLEEPTPGARKLHKKLLRSGRRHLRIGLGVSKTRARRAAPGQAISRWRSLVQPEELCNLTAYAERAGPEGYSFEPLLSNPRSRVRQLQIPVKVEGLHVLPPCTTSSVHMGVAAGTFVATAPRPAFEQLTCNPDLWEQKAYGEACEEFLDWLGAIHLNLNTGQTLESGNQVLEKVLKWTMGESLIGPEQIMHALDTCIKVHASWFILSFWGAEDAPISHHGGAHGFDVTGAHHVHLLVVLSPSTIGCSCLLLEGANALHACSN